jgi:hypothetical protein
VSRAGSDVEDQAPVELVVSLLRERLYGLITLLAVCRTELPWWQQALAVVVLAGIGARVLVIKIPAH